MNVRYMNYEKDHRLPLTPRYTRRTVTALVFSDTFTVLALGVSLGAILGIAILAKLG